jgi:thiosulfate dehydrogenase
MKKVMAVAVTLLVLGFAAFVAAQATKTDMDPAKALAQSIDNGKKLFSDPSLGTNGMSCSSCHMEGGTKAMKMGDMDIRAFDNLSSKYPGMFMMAKKVLTLTQVVNMCIMNPMKGKPLAWDDPKLTDLTAYCASVKAGK